MLYFQIYYLRNTFTACVKIAKMVGSVPLEVAHKVVLSEDQETSRIGRNRQRSPNDWKTKHVKHQGVRKNSILIIIWNQTECCKKKCLHSFSTLHLDKVRSEFKVFSMSSKMSTYTDFYIIVKENKKTSGHARKTIFSTSSGGNSLGKPPAEISQFGFEYTVWSENGSPCVSKRILLCAWIWAQEVASAAMKCSKWPWRA